MLNCSPIVIFTYDRLTHLKQVIQSLQSNSEAPNSPVIIYSDAAGSQGAAPGVESVRHYLRSVSGFRSTAVVVDVGDLCGGQFAIVNPCFIDQAVIVRAGCVG